MEASSSSYSLPSLVCAHGQPLSQMPTLHLPQPDALKPFEILVNQNQPSLHQGASIRRVVPATLKTLAQVISANPDTMLQVPHFPIHTPPNPSN